MQALEVNSLSEVPAATVPLAPPATWLVASILPALWQPPVAGAIAWGLAILLGGLIARGQLLRWVALGWIASLAIPGAPFLAIAASGAIAKEGRHVVYAAVLGTGLCLLGLPQVLLNAGTLLILAGGVAALWRKG